MKNFIRTFAFSVLVTTSAAAVAPYKIAVLGDTQRYSQIMDEGGEPDYFTYQTQWVADNAASENIVFLTHVGDVIQDQASRWVYANASVSLIDGVIPYSITFGNHDGGAPNVFGAARYNSYPWYEGASANDLCHAQTFTAGGITFLHINLRHSPTAADRTWAQGIINAHPGKPTIISTHGYMADNSPGRANNGNNIWNDLVEPNAQVFMVFCGHDWVNRREIDTTTDGRKILQIMANWQQNINGGNGWMHLLTFDPDNSQILVDTYSPFLDLNRTDTTAQYTISATFSTAGAGSVTINGMTGLTTASWSGGGGDANWQTADNWGGTAPSPGDLLEFGNFPQKVSNNNYPAGTSFAGMHFTVGTFSNGYEFNGNAITLTGDIVNGATYGPNTARTGPAINMPLILIGDRQINTGDWDMTINSVISGSGSLAKIHGRDYIGGSYDGGVHIGDLYLTNNNTYTGDTKVVGGALFLDNSTSTNSIASSPNLEVYYHAVLHVQGLQNGTLVLASGQTLKGRGRVLGKTTAASGSIISPGHAAPNTFEQLGDLTMAPGSAFQARVGGKNEGEYAQLEVAGTADLGGATLDLAQHGSYAPQVGDNYILIENDGTDAITGQFVSGNGSHLAAGTALPEGTVVSTDFLGSGLSSQISYTGGTGNDVVLEVLPPPGSPVFTDDPIVGAKAESGIPYQDSITGSALDGDGDPLVYEKVSGPTWLTVNPGGSLSGTPAAGDLGANAFTVRVSDDDGNTDTATLNITVVPKKLVGLWEFDDSGDLGKATVGTDLRIAGTPPTYSASMADGGSTTLTGVISTIDGTANYLDVTHNIGANGGGSFTNQYTLVYDVKRPNTTEWRSFFQTALGNNNDAEYFTRGGGGTANSLGRSTIGYSSSAMASETWMRLAISVDLQASTFRTYVDGALFHNHAAPALDGGYSLEIDRVLLFADNNGENDTLDVGRVAMYRSALTDSQIAALGSAGEIDSDGDDIVDSIDTDDDNDGMTDTWENANGLNPLVDDSGIDADGDGFSNLEEYAADTDPQSGTSVPSASVVPSSSTGEYDLTFSTSANRYYTVQYSDTLSVGSWQVLGVAVLGTGSNMTVPLGTSPDRRFYRVSIDLP